MKKNIKSTALIIVAVVAVTVVMRLVPHPANFVPVGALALLCGTMIRSRWGIVIPLAVMVASDLVIGLHSLILFTWGGFLLFGAIGWWIRQQRNVWRIVGGSLAGSITFFLLTNFAVWAFTPLYAKTVAGLYQCFLMAVPFFRNGLLGDLFYTGIFFGAYYAIHYLAAAKSKPEAELEKNNFGVR